MNKVLKWCVLVSIFNLAAIGLSPAKANEFGYLEAQVTQVSQSDVTADTGYGIELSIPLSEKWYLIGSNIQSELISDIGVEMDFTNWYLGAGRHWTISPTSTLYLQLSAETQKLAADIGRTDRRGASFELGNHYRVNDNWVLTAYGRYSDINIASMNDRSDEFYFGARLSYQFKPNLEIGFGYESGDFSRTELGLRFRF
ncbi:porin family protein [Aliikangiella marina]|uniref:Porin family protein n=1 Tax=Aliikangiella marina TaxID=1712262 RepID=A0A545TCM9_9GAMM|nr:transporter [Aliikangiella marina]TQV74936.1 porin family protein [Aliikangiella marina]